MFVRYGMSHDVVLPSASSRYDLATSSQLEESAEGAGSQEERSRAVAQTASLPQRVGGGACK